jgi:uncharacterized protein (DUF952 family)
VTAETYHLTPVEWWSGADPDAPLGAPSLAHEGFVHCTTGAAEMVETANRHYRDDPRSFVVLTIDLDQVGSPLSVEDVRGIYPHIHGPIDRRAITRVREIARAPDGTFLPFEP